jgi:hypothetical protein
VRLGEYPHALRLGAIVRLGYRTFVQYRSKETLSARDGSAGGCRSAPHDPRAGLIGADMETTMRMGPYGLDCLPCDRVVRSPDVAPLRGSIKEEEATETPHPSQSLTRLHSSGLNPAPQVDLGPIGGGPAASTAQGHWVQRGLGHTGPVLSNTVSVNAKRWS